MSAPDIAAALTGLIGLVIGVVVFLAVLIVIFLLLRQVTLWYFRLNQIADNLAVIADYYRSQPAAATPPTAAPPPPAPATPGGFPPRLRSAPRP